MKYLSAIVFALLMTSCYQEQTMEPAPPGVCDADTVSFSSTIFAEIINPSCNTTGCHDAGTNSGGYSFETYDQISSNATVIGQVINHDPSVVPMPLGQPKLADSLLQAFECWVEQGLLDN